MEDGRMEGYREFVNRALEEWKVPGAGLAVVRDGQTVLSDGFGFRDLQARRPVTPQTLFAIGSCTKAVTCAAMALLVDDGQLEWDRPVREYLPSFRMHDPYVSDHMMPRDLVTHRSGLPRHDLVWYGSRLTRKEIFDRLRYLEPNKGFRELYQYQNIMYMTAGYLVGEIAGCSWEEFVRRRILDPLDMPNANFSVEDLRQAPDHALPYRENEGKVEEIPFKNIDAIGPAGSINAGVEEMVRWVLLNLNGGKWGEQQIIAEAAIRQLHTPQAVVPDPGKHPEFSHPTYGLGWVIQTYRGELVLHHGGGIDGFSALVSFMPRRGIGMVILTNLGGTPLPFIVSGNAYDRLLGMEEVAWNERIRSERDEAKQAEAKSKEESAAGRKEGTRPSHALEEYAGAYEHPAYGTITISADAERLKADYNGCFALAGEHYHYDLFEFTEEKIPDFKMKATFLTDMKGTVDRLTMPLEPAVSEIVFTRRADPQLADEAFLARCAGEYELMGLTATIALRGDALTVSVPGQPDYELIPHAGNEFRLKGLSGFSVEFRTDASGAVTEAVLTQPNGVFVARRK